MRRALIMVDIQNDFCPGGSLAVEKGDEIVPYVNDLKRTYKGEIVVATQDWHPPEHISFARNHPGKVVFNTMEIDGGTQVLWPVHCVQNTIGANLRLNLDLQGVTIFRKGENPKIDSYSGFYDNNKRASTGLGNYLRNFGIGKVAIVGLATDYCVKATAVDAKGLGFETTVYLKGCRGINEQTVAAAIVSMKNIDIEVLEG